jgi:hypothetical protein
MKTFFLVILMTGMAIPLIAQAETLHLQDSLWKDPIDTTSIHMAGNVLNLGLAIGYPWSAGAHISILSWRGMGLGFGIKLSKIRSSEHAVDFKKATIDLKPGDILITYSLFFIKEFPTERKNIKAGLELGIAFVDYAAARFEDQNIGSFMEQFSSLGSSNYYIGYAHRYTIGMSYKLRLNFPFRDYMGMEMALAGNLNMYKPYIGFELGWTINRRRKSPGRRE